MNAISIDDVLDMLRNSLRNHLVLSKGSQGAVSIWPELLSESDGRMSLLWIDVRRDRLNEYREKVNGV